MKQSLIIITLMILSALSCYSQEVDNTTVDNLDLDRFLGKWYEIARYDHRFERDLEFASAEYSLLPNGKILVTNRGLKNGNPAKVEGKAKLTDQPGLLRVSFFGPFYSDYRIMMLAPDYSYALVGSGNAKYLWILSRTREMAEKDKLKVLSEATARGYGVSRLIWVKQSITTE